METIKRYVICSVATVWICLSFGTPLLASSFVDKLGKCENIICLGESGMIIDANTRLPIEPKTSFEHSIANRGVFPITMFFGPFAIPISLFYMASTSVFYGIHKISRCNK